MKQLILAAIFALVFGSVAKADTVILRDGREIEGEICERTKSGIFVLNAVVVRGSGQPVPPQFERLWVPNTAIVRIDEEIGTVVEVVR